MFRSGTHDDADANEERILDELHELEPGQWEEVLDLIGSLKHGGAESCEPSRGAEMTARDLLESGLVGIWPDRDDIEDSLAFGRRLRREAERRQGYGDDTD